MDGAVAASHRRGLGAALWRVRQFTRVLTARSDPTVDAELRRLLASEAQWQLLARLTPFDRAHHLRVYEHLIGAGHTDPDLLRAALLHDVGKADARGRVRLIHRVLHVLLGSASNDRLTRIADGSGWFRHGLWLSVHHPALGAVLVRAVGGSERCCSLIGHHGDLTFTADPLALALAAADNASIQ